MNRLGTVVFWCCSISGFPSLFFLLTGDYVVLANSLYNLCDVLPISFLLSMLPTYESLGKKAIIRLFQHDYDASGCHLSDYDCI